MAKLREVDVLCKGVLIERFKALKPSGKDDRGYYYYEDSIPDEWFLEAWEHDPYIPYHNALAMHGCTNRNESWLQDGCKWWKRASREIDGQRLYHMFVIGVPLRKGKYGKYGYRWLKNK